MQMPRGYAIQTAGNPSISRVNAPRCMGKGSYVVQESESASSGPLMDEVEISALQQPHIKHT